MSALTTRPQLVGAPIAHFMGMLGGLLTPLVREKPIHLLVLLASPPDKTSDHIQALGKISRLVANPEFREKAYDAPTAEALYDLFEQYDS